MFKTIIYALPCIMCAFWTLIFFFRKKNISQKFYIWLIFVGIFYFFTYSLYISPNTDYALMVRLDVMCQPLALALLELMLMYVERHLERPILPMSIKIALCLPPLLHLGFVTFIYYLLSFDEAAALTEAYDKAQSIGGMGDPFDIMPELLTSKLHRLYISSDVVVFSGLCAFYSLCIFAMCAYSSFVNRESFRAIPRFFTHSDFSGMIHLVNFAIVMVIISVGPLVSMGRSYVFNNPELGMWMSITLSLCIFLGAYVEFVGETFFRKSDLRRIINEKLGKKEKDDMDDDMTDFTDEDEEEGSKMDDGQVILVQENVAFNEDIDRMFINSMEVEKVYTDSALTIDSLAQKLKTNRSTLSALVNKKYGMTFKTMLATYRIAFAKQYMLEHPGASVDDVAEVSGFGDRSSFFHKFKEVTGMSPKVWLTKQ
ncbi:MAG: AraC family transcriptional regulator [Bacteroidaceae bacterium]|nr:AraC family transcriptional regulator [Bacteroidaceae bacterium]